MEVEILKKLTPIIPRIVEENPSSRIRVPSINARVISAQLQFDLHQICIEHNFIYCEIHLQSDCVTIVFANIHAIKRSYCFKLPIPCSTPTKEMLESISIGKCYDYKDIKGAFSVIISRFEFGVDCPKDTLEDLKKKVNSIIEPNTYSFSEIRAYVRLVEEITAELQRLFNIMNELEELREKASQRLSNEALVKLIKSGRADDFARMLCNLKLEE